MDGSENKNALLQEVEWGVGGITLGLLAFALLFVALNYFNILTLSAFIPGLSFLPHRPYTTQPQSPFMPTSTTQTPESTQTASEVLGDKMPCPTVSEFCQNGRDIIVDGVYAGFGGTPVAGSEIKAVVDGSLTAQASIFPPNLGREEIAAIYIDNKDKQERVAYYFKGVVPAAKEVKKGEVIGTVGTQMTTYDNASLLFQLIKGDPIKGERVKITPQDFDF